MSMRPYVHRVVLKTQSDARLVELASGGHGTAFDEIMARYRRPIERYCGQLMPASMADDVVQQTFVSAWRALSAGAPVRELRPWIYCIARNAVLKALERDRVDADELPEALQGGPSPANQLELRETMRRTLEALGELPEHQRVALVGTALEGRTRQDLARELDLTEGAVRQLVHRARCSMRSAANAVLPLPLVQRLLAYEAATGPAGEAGTVAGAAAVGLVAKLGLVVATTAVVAAGAPVVVQATRWGGTAEARAASANGRDATNARAAALPAPAPFTMQRLEPVPAAPPTRPGRGVHPSDVAPASQDTGTDASGSAAAVDGNDSPVDDATLDDASTDDAPTDDGNDTSTDDSSASPDDATPPDAAPDDPAADPAPEDASVEPDPSAEEPAAAADPSTLTP
jgi:RNA polymerase sigma factor (sigma-70 family)